VPPPQADAFAVSGSARQALSAEHPVILPSGPIVLDIRAVTHSGGVRLDGRHLPVAFDRTAQMATAALNLDRATGYHQLRIGADRRYVFGTDDAKLRIDGVVEMLAYLREHTDALGLSWNGTVQFSGAGQVLRDVRLDVAWLEQHLSEIAEIAASISRRPFTVSRKRHELSRQGVPDVAATSRLIRRRPDLMEPHAEGPVTFQGQQWAPRAFLRQRREHTADTPGNRTMTRLLLAVLELARTCQASAPSALNAELSVHVGAAARALRRQPFASIRRQRGHLRIGAHPSTEERIDGRYRRGRALLHQLLSDRHWDPLNQVTEEWAFASLADQVFQAFASIVVARSFDLVPVAPIGQSGPHFASHDYEMWVDSAPPDDVLHNWRDDTSTPAALRPDIVLRRKSDHRVAILDAKYRSGGLRATPGSLSEVQLYLQAYGCRAVCVLFPPTAGSPPWEPHLVTNQHFAITELPLRPMDDLAGYMADVLRPAIERSVHIPSPTRKSAVDAAQAEAEASAVQAAAVRTLVADGEVVRLTHPTAMIATENNLSRLLAPIWSGLGDDIQKMLITAEYFGDQVPPGFDHSGPVLGLFAACERLARDCLFTPSDSALAGEFRRVTFGEAAETLRRLPKWRGGREQTLRSWAIRQAGTDVEALGRCGKAMLAVNKWRIAAAHAVLVDKSTWDKTHTIVLDKQNGLLMRLYDALPEA
jgi:hypothetical protein